MLGWFLLAPAFLLGGLTIAVPIVLHLLRRERLPRVPFSDTRFLKQRAPEPRRRRRLDDLLLLAMRVAALLLLVLAFARPYLADAPTGQAITVVLVDTSFSMSTPAQVTEARDLAVSAIDDAPVDHLVAVVAFDSEARLLADVGSSRAAARAAVASVEPRPRATRYRAGAVAAADLAAGRDGRLVVITDRQATGWSPGIPIPSLGLSVEVLPVAPPPGNLAVTDVGHEPDAILATVVRTGAPVESAVSLELDGETVATLDVTVEPGVNTVRFPVAAEASGVALVRATDPDGFEVDNVRRHLLDPLPRPRVQLVTDQRSDAGLLFLEQALAPDGGVGRFALERRTVASLGDDDAGLDPGGVAILAGTTRLTRRGRAHLDGFVRAGGGLLVVGGEAVDPALVNGLFAGEPDLGVGAVETLAAPRTLLLAERRHPSLTALGGLAAALDRVRFSRARTIAEGDVVLARFDDGAPVLVEHRVGRGRVLVWASDLAGEWNDLPRQPVFAPWLTEALASLSTETPLVRAFLVRETPPGVADRPGVASLVTEGGEQQRIVVNADPAESDLSRLEPGDFERRFPAADLGSVMPVSSPTPDDWLWRYLLAAALVLLLAEGLVASRRAGRAEAG
jgi:hypothetical protein